MNDLVESLEAEVLKLKAIIKNEADYLYQEANAFKLKDWNKKAKEKQGRGDALMKNLENRR